jgi:hypothetical protein
MNPNPRPPHPLEMEPPPLRRATAALPIWVGRGMTEETFWILGQRIQWWGIHWINGRALPCLAPHGRCYQCEQGWLPRRVGYTCGMRDATGGRYLLRISEYAYRGCPALAIVGISYRGTPLTISRRAWAPNAPWVIRVPVRPARPDLPPAIPVEATLSYVWGIDLRCLTEDPPADGDASTRLRPYRRERRGEG